MIKALAVETAVVGVILAATVAAAVPEEPVRHWHFAVLLDGKRIGEHDFSVVRHSDEVDVTIEAHFKVKALFIPLYGYDHEDREVWRGGCLARIDSRTDDNGRKSAVHGVLMGNVFEVASLQRQAALPACVKTFAYWDQSFLTESRLLNSQTGEYQSVNLTRHGLESIRVGGHAIEAQHYSLGTERFGIDLWYSNAGDWVALESKLENGRTLRYESQ